MYFKRFLISIFKLLPVYEKQNLARMKCEFQLVFIYFILNEMEH